MSRRIVLSDAGERRVQLELDQRKSVPHSHWHRLASGADSGAAHRITIALRQQNLESLTAIAKAVSTPGSSRYADYLSVAQVRSLVAPSKDNVHSVARWILETIGRTAELTQGGDFMSVLATAGEVERLLDVRMDAFVHEVTGERLHRVVEHHYSVPEHVADAIDFVGGLHRFPRRAESDARRHTTSMVRDARVSASTAAAAAGKAPMVLSVAPGDRTLRAFVLPYCANGEPTQSSSGPCYDQASGNGLTSMTAFFEWGVQTPPFTAELGFPIAQMQCHQCSAWSGGLGASCAAAARELSLSTATVFCLTPSLTLLPNYVELSMSMRSTFASGDHSPVRAYTARPLFLGEFSTVSAIRARYDVPVGLVGGRAASNNMAVAEFLGQYYSNDDLDQFAGLYGLPPLSPLTSVIGPNNQSQPGGEASLDIDYIMGIAPGIPTTFWSLGQLHDGQEPFLQWITDVLSASEITLVHSVSYADDEGTLSLDYMSRIDAEFQKAAAVGISIFFAAGDNGVTASTPGEPLCAGNRWQPSFPSSSPWITSVSGTQFSDQWQPGCTAQAPQGLLQYTCERQEIVSSTTTGSRITSGSGFSNVFATPGYQKSMVDSYVSNVLVKSVPSSWYNASGRAYGDISALARNYPTVIGGELIAVDGTSAAAPSTAAIVALINDELLRKGLKPVGFLNPAIYSMPSEAFFDVVQGDSACDEELRCCAFAPKASYSYDVVSGRGTPRFRPMLHYLIGLQESSK
jgi:tripeptidyl-peptidase I